MSKFLRHPGPKAKHISVDNTLNYNRTAGLALSSVPYDVEENETFRLLNGALGTTYRPDDVPGDQPWNATTPASNGYLTFSEQAVAHAGFDLGTSSFWLRAVIHGL